MLFRDQLGETLYTEYTSASTKLKKETEDKFEFYSENPRAHPQYEALSKNFATSVDSSTASGSELRSLWWNYWSNCFNSMKEENLQKQLNELRETFIKKSMETKVSAMPSNDSDIVEGTLQIIEKLRKSLGAIGSALLSMVTDCRELGTTSPKALAVFTDEENIQLLKLALEKLEGLKQKSEGNTKTQYHTAIVAIKHLMQFAKENSKRSEGIDIKMLAKLTMGKDSAQVVNMIKTACICDGDLNPSKEKISELFMQVCSTQFQLMSKE